jgi:hypothetical protein
MLGPDCDDNDPARAEHLHEVCDGIDNDCNGYTDDPGVCACRLAWQTDQELTPHAFCEQELTYDQAKAACAAMPGYRLAYVETEQEHDFITGVLAGYPHLSGLAKRWIDLTEQGIEGNWRWGDGTAPTFEPWQPGRPNGGTGENCVSTSSVGEWDDEPCGNSRFFICEVDPALTARNDPDCDDGDGDGRGPQCALGPDCDDEDEDSWGLVTRWYDADGDGHSNHPPLEQACTDGEMAAEVGGQAPFDCDDSNALLQFATDGTCVDRCTIVMNGDHQYSFCRESVGWDTASETCTTAGRGTLATINDAEEDLFIDEIRDYLHLNTLWIGYTDAAIEGLWVWTNGENASYTGWVDPEPNNTNDEDCGAMNAGTNGWDDRDCLTSFDFLCELSPGG